MNSKGLLVMGYDSLPWQVNRPDQPVHKVRNNNHNNNNNNNNNNVDDDRTYFIDNILTIKILFTINSL